MAERFCEMVCKNILSRALQLLVLHIHGRCLIPLIHRVSLLLFNYCLFCIVLCSSQMPGATEDNTGHNGQTERGDGSWQKGAAHSLTNTHTHKHMVCKCTCTPASTVHEHAFMGTNTHTYIHTHRCSKAQSWHNNGKAERARLIYEPL